jgi:hypothetical protein
VFFFEKKNQKTFAQQVTWPSRSSGGLQPTTFAIPIAMAIDLRRRAGQWSGR